MINNIKKLTFEKDGTSIDCVVFGKGRKTLVMLPGLSFQRVKKAALLLAFTYRIFSKEYTVYVIDKKEAVPDGYTIREIADDTAFVMEKLGLCGTDVLGISQGGMAAQYLAIGYPHLVRRLVLGVTASRRNEVMENAVVGWAEMAERHDYEAFVTDMLGKMYSENYIKKYGRLFPLISKIFKPKPQDFTRFTALAKACLTCASYPELGRIACPVFVIGGRQDHIVTGKASEDIAEVITDCRIHMYDDLGHSAYEEAPDFNKRIYQFLSE